MESLFDQNIIFVFFFAMIAIYNYSSMKEYQRMAIIYISVYALTVLNIIGIKMAAALLAVSLFSFFEIFESDELKFKILINPLYKIIDAAYISFAQYAFGEMCCALLMLKVKLPQFSNDSNGGCKVLSVLFFVLTLTRTLQQKYVISSFDEMYAVFTQFPINKVKFNKKLDDACTILVSIEDAMYFDRKAYSFISIRYIAKVLKYKIGGQRNGSKIMYLFRTGNQFVKNIFSESRGYSTLPMQLVRTLGVKRGYNCKIRRKIFEILYSNMVFKGIERMLKEECVAQRQYFKKYLLYIYFHCVNTFLGDATFSKFLNAFDMKYSEKNEKDIYDCTNEGIFIACMGLSKRASSITPDNISYYLNRVNGVDLNKDVICDMVKNMMKKPYEGNYLR